MADDNNRIGERPWAQSTNQGAGGLGGFLGHPSSFGALGGSSSSGRGGIPLPTGGYSPTGINAPGVAAGAGHMDPYTSMLIASLTQSGLGFLGGLLNPQQPNFQPRIGFTGANDPDNRLSEYFDTLHSALGGLNSQHLPDLPTFDFQGPKPVSIGGVQIGGGLATDPALRDHSQVGGFNMPQLDLSSILGGMGRSQAPTSPTGGGSGGGTSPGLRKRTPKDATVGRGPGDRTPQSVGGR